MLKSLLLLLACTLTAVLAVSPAGIAILPEREVQTVILPPLKWVTEFGDAIQPGTTMDLSWTGGNAALGYEVYYIPRWKGQLKYDLVPIVANTNDMSVKWKVPKIDTFPNDTTIIVGVKDGSEGSDDDHRSWWDLSPSLPFATILPPHRA